MEDFPVVTRVLALYLTAVLSPGPNFAVITGQAVASSRVAGVWASLGVTLSSLTWAVVTLAGLAVLLQEATWISASMRLAGAAYLVYLGGSAWLHARPRSSLPTTGPRTVERGSSFLRGLLTGLSNPKGVAFFVGLYAAAIPPEMSPSTRLLILAGSFFIEFAWYSSVALVFSSGPARAVYARSAALIDRVFGTLLLVIGVRLFYSL